eukprot:COSAG01_NODE_17428_length_1152_cov_1.433998_1_plen_220_part_10
MAAAAAAGGTRSGLLPSPGQQQQQGQQALITTPGDPSASDSHSARAGRASSLRSGGGGGGGGAARWAAAVPGNGGRQQLHERWGGDSGSRGQFRSSGGRYSSGGSNRGREDRSYEYRADAAGPCVHPRGVQEGVGECFGSVVRQEAAEHEPLTDTELATIAAAAAAHAERWAAGQEQHEEEEDHEKGSEEPFFDAFLTAAVQTEGTDMFHELARQKQRLA